MDAKDLYMIVGFAPNGAAIVRQGRNGQEIILDFVLHERRLYDLILLVREDGRLRPRYDNCGRHITDLGVAGAASTPAETP